MKLILAAIEKVDKPDECYSNNALQYEPERLGLTLVAELEYSDRCYVFDTRKVWQRLSDNTLWTARSSGCSCPSPFEEVTELDRVFNLEDLEAEYLENDWRASNVSPEQWQSFKEIVSKALAEVK